MLCACSIRAHSKPIPKSPVMDASVVFSGETAEKRSGPADHMSGEAEDKNAQKLSSPPEHPRVTLLRHRPLMAFLQDQGFHDSYNELMSKTRAHMSLWHLRGLVERGRWGDAVEYLDRYLPPSTPTRPRSLRADVFRQFLVMHHRFADAVAGMGDKFLPRNYVQVSHAAIAASHAELRLRSITFSILAVDEVRANMNWQRVRNTASLVVSRLAGSTPELRGYIDLPATSIKPHHVLPIASGLWSRRRYVKKKQTGRPKAIIRVMKSRLMVPRIGSVDEANELLADLLDETLRDGVQLVTYGVSRPLQPGGTEGAQFCQPMFSTFTEDITSGTLANAGTNKHVVEAGCHTNTASQDLDGKRKSEELTIVEKLERDFKLQRLTGAFGGARPVVSGPGAVVNLGAKLSGVSSG